MLALSLLFTRDITLRARDARRCVAAIILLLRAAVTPRAAAADVIIDALPRFRLLIRDGAHMLCRLSPPRCYADAVSATLMLRCVMRAL